MATAREKAYYAAGLAGPRLENTKADKLTKALEKIEEAFEFKDMMAPSAKEKEKVAADKAAAIAEANRRFGPQEAPAAPVPPKKDDKVSLGPKKDADGKSVLPQTLPETATGPNGKTLYLHPDGKYRAYIPAGR